MSIPYAGEIFSFLCAITWAMAVIFFRLSGKSIGPFALNLFKNVVAVLLFLITLLMLGKSPLRPVPAMDYIMLLLSGIIGIAISDTIYFKSLNILGAGLSSIVNCTYSPTVILFSFIFLRERLDFWQFVGTALILSAIIISSRRVDTHHITSGDLIKGIIWGVLSMALVAFSIVMVKPILNRSPVLWSAEMRLIGGAMAMLIMLPFYPQKERIIASINPSKEWRFIISGIFLGGYLSMILWVAGMKYTLSSVAAVINQTSIIFVFIFAGIFLKEPMSLRRSIGIILAICGVILTTVG